MLRLALSVHDLAGLRFAFSPLWEVVASVRVLKEPGAHAIHLPWVKAARARLAGAALDLQLLSALVPVPTRVLPGFLAPTPESPLPDLDAETAALAHLAPDSLRRDLTGVFGDHLSGPLHELHREPEVHLPRLADQMRAYWNLVLAADWPRIRGVLEGDVMYRARRLADGGPHLLFADLDGAISWSDGTLALDLPTVTADHVLDGRGLVLVPSAFVWPRVFAKVDRRWAPVIRYAPRGVGTLWQGGGRTDDGLAGVLGRSRAGLLAELDAPASTGELARRTGLSPAGVSQHLSRLKAAGLVTSHRAGHVVLYARTARAVALRSQDNA